MRKGKRLHRRRRAGRRARWLQNFQAIHVRIGMHTGKAIRDADTFFGKTVILASRIASQADGDEILVSADTKAAAAGGR